MDQIYPAVKEADVVVLASPLYYWNMSGQLRTAIDRLPQQQRMLILLRYYKGLTQDKTAKILGVSQVQVSRLEKKAIQFLRQELQED